MLRIKYPDMIMRSNDYYYDKDNDEYLEISSYGVLRGDFDRAIEHVMRVYNWKHNRNYDKHFIENDRNECKCFVARYIDNFVYYYNGKYRSAFSYVTHLARFYFKHKLKELQNVEYNLHYCDMNKLSNRPFIERRFSYDGDYDNVIYMKQIKKYLRECINNMDSESRYIVCKYYGIDCNPMTRSEIAKSLNRDRKTISYKERKILERLRKNFIQNCITE